MIVSRGCLASLFLLAIPAATFAQAVPESVYPPPEPAQSDDSPTAEGGVEFLLDVRYTTDYIWRGIERFDAGRNEDELNLQLRNKLSFDLGKLPHPYVDLFVNIAENDPVSSFQEVRPTLGFDWNVRPVSISVGHTSYIFPDREDSDSAEVFLKLRLDDSALFRSERPILHPYVLAAYDYDLWEGLYVQAGVEHVIPIENTGLRIGLTGNISYVNGHGLFTRVADADSGLQAWEAGVWAKFELNNALNIPSRFGQWSLTGYLNYTSGIDKELLATDQLWGGAGLSFEF